jgi:methylmalonyl-CoA mutase, C-terminal domain
MIVSAALQEDVDAVGLSVLSGAHMHYFTEVATLLRERGAPDILLFGGGIVPDVDLPVLRELGVGTMFTPGTSTQDVVAYLRETVAERRGAAEAT